MVKKQLRLSIVFLGLAVGLGLLLTVGLLFGMGLTGSTHQALAQEPDSDSGRIGALAMSGVVTGRVTVDAPGNLPLEGALVRLYDSVTAAPLVTVTTNAAGLYTTTVFADGDAVRVRFVMTHCAPIYYDNQTSWDSADPVTLSQFIPMTNINASLEQTTFGVITGVVTDATTSNPLSLTLVSAFDASTDEQLQTTLTGLDGQYSLPDIAMGTYNVKFYKQGYATQYYHFQTTLTDATVMTMGLASVISNVNAGLGLPTGCLSGTVVAASNSFPLPGVTAAVYAPASQTLPVTRVMGITLTRVSPAGTYEICGLDGQYLVHFRKEFYVPQFFDGKFGTDTADLVTVVDGQTTPDIDGALFLGGCVSGPVVDQEGTVRPGAVVSAYNQLGNPVGIDVPPPPSSTQNYRVCQLPAGDYELRCVEGTYMSGSTDVTVQVGKDISHTCVMQGEPPGPEDTCIAGTVTAESGGAVLGQVAVAIYQATGSTKVAETQTDALGLYRVCNLDSVYRVGFNKAAYIAEWYDNQPTLLVADLVTVTLGQTVTVDAALAEDPSFAHPMYMPLIMKNG